MRRIKDGAITGLIYDATQERFAPRHKEAVTLFSLARFLRCYKCKICECILVVPLYSLRYAFGIVQVKLFTLPDGSFVAMPSVLAKTEISERHVTIVLAQN